MQSPGADADEFDIPQAQLTPVDYQNGQRVYVRLSGTLKPGRIVVDPDRLLDPSPWPETELPGQGGREIVGLTGGRKMWVPHSEILPLSGEPIDDPTYILAAQITEGSWWYRKRRTIRDLAIDQRNAYAGVAALASAAIEIEEHQFRIARRILHDPVCRYILADEVGLGKTIEAGIVLRQHLMENDSALDAIVVAPRHLLGQWESELREKFALGPALDEGRLRLSTMRQFGQSPNRSESAFRGMLVVDEAHHTSELAFSNDEDEQRTYRRLSETSATAARVLLLSATPVLRNEDGFLAMLHLLDPAAHPLEDRAAFVRRVRDRQPIGEVVQSLIGRVPRLLVGSLATRIRELFPDDLVVMELVEEFEKAGRDARFEVQQRLSRRIRRAYRLYDRLIRTRRNDPVVEPALPVRDARSKRFESQCIQELEDVLEQWRGLALAEVSETYSDCASCLFANWVELLLEDPRELVASWSERLSGIETGTLEALFPSETEVLSGGARIDCESFRSELGNAIRSILYEPGSHRLICFATSSRLCAELQRQIGPVSVVYDPSLELIDSQRVILVSQNYEEGLNLQRREAELIHADLPLSQTRIEQRTGRVDRLGGVQTSVRSTVLLRNGRYLSSWYDAIVSSGGVFERSVSNLQCLLSEAENQIRDNLWEHGSEAFTQVAVALASPTGSLSIEAEENRVREQDVLDSTGFGRYHGPDAFTRLDDHEFQAATEFAEAVYDWCVQGLQFKALDTAGDPFGETADRRPPKDYPFRFLMRDRLVSRRDIVRHLGAAGQPMGRFWKSIWSTLGRKPDYDIAGSRTPSPLRIGHPLVDGVLAAMESDDRGRGFTRLVQGESPFSPGVYFCFEFIAEVGAFTEGATERRMADGRFPPQVFRVWTASTGRECADDVRGLLEKVSTRESRGVVSIRSEEHWALAETTLGSDWHATTIRLRTAAANSLTESAEWISSVSTAKKILTRDLADARQHLQDRASAGSAATMERNALESEIELLEGFLDSVDRISPRLDALGCIVVPFESED
jgi:ATP-dependent helicase HepA